METPLPPTRTQDEPVLVPGAPVPGAPRRELRLARISFGVLFALATFLLAYIASPFFAPLFLAAVLATLFHKPFEHFTRLLKGRRRLAAALFTLGVFLVLVAPFASVVAFAVRETVLGLSYVRDTLGVHSVSQIQSGQLPPRAEALVERTLSVAHVSRANLQEYAGRFATKVQEVGTTAVAESSHMVMQTVVMLIAFFFFIYEGHKLVRLIARISPLESRQTEELLHEFRNVSSAAVLGTVATSVFQGITAGLGFALFGVPHALFFGLLTMLASFIPVVGTAIIWAPAVALLLATGHHGAALGLLAWSLVVVVGAEHVVKPLVLRGRAEMNTGLVILSLLGGLEMFGLIGVLVGPVIVAFFLALVRMYERDFVARRQQVH